MSKPILKRIIANLLSQHSLLEELISQLLVDPSFQSDLERLVQIDSDVKVNLQGLEILVRGEKEKAALASGSHLGKGNSYESNPA